ATEIVGNALGHPGLLARGHPRAPEGLDRLSGAVEYPGDGRARRLLFCSGSLPLALEDGPQIRRERKLTALVILGLARLQPVPPPAKVHVDPLAGQKLRLHTPAQDVVGLEDDSEIDREVGEHGIEFAPLEETGSRLVLLEHVDVGPAYDPADFLAKPEHALERGELPVDGSVRGRVLLPMPDIGERALLRRRLRAASREEFSEVVDGVLHAVE